MNYDSYFFHTYEKKDGWGYGDSGSSIGNGIGYGFEGTYFGKGSGQGIVDETIGPSEI
jgi:hypothetical protein